MAGHNIINTRYTFTSTAHPYTLMEKGPSVQNIETVRFFSL